MKVEEFIKKYNISYAKVNEREWGSYEVVFAFFNDDSFRVSFQGYIFGFGFPLDVVAPFVLVDFAKHQLLSSDTRIFIGKFGQEIFNDFSKLEWKTLEEFWPDDNISKSTALVKYV